MMDVERMCVWDIPELGELGTLPGISKQVRARGPKGSAPFLKYLILVKFFYFYFINLFIYHII